MATSEYYNSHALPLPPPSHDPHSPYPQSSQHYDQYQTDQPSYIHGQGQSYHHHPLPHHDEYDSGNHQVHYQDFQPPPSTHQYPPPSPHLEQPPQLPQAPLSPQIAIRQPLPRGPESPSSHPDRPNTRGRGFSLRSDKPHEKKVIETHAEKEAKRIHSKADPTLAMSEAEPSTVAAMISEPTHTSLRMLVHTDWTTGKPIADPDKSNPTRSRWERPLDTIRSFERAIDAENNRKSVYLQSDAGSVVAWNRQSGYYTQDNPRSTHHRDSYHRNSSFRPESTQFELVPPVPRSSYYGDGVGDGENGPGPRGQGAWGPRGGRRAPRGYSDAHCQPNSAEQHQPVYGLQHKDRSYETVTSAAASGTSADQAGYQTDPTSSDNSSIDRASPAKPAEPVNDYGIGFEQPAQYAPNSFSVSTPAAQSSSQPLPAQPKSSEVPEPPLQKRLSVLRRVSTAGSQKEGENKKTSWLRRRFSRNVSLRESDD